MIAISYRREDSLPIAGRLYDRLQAKFGKKNVFMDFDSIPPGADFREHIKEMIERSKLVIAIIGPHWLGEQPDASRRIDNPADFVRLEIAYALEAGIPVIPLLINTTQMPKPEMLPPDIQELAFRHALPLDSGMDFHNHADRLIVGIGKATDAARKRGHFVADSEKAPHAAPTAQTSRASLGSEESKRKLIGWNGSKVVLGTSVIFLFALASLVGLYVSTHQHERAKQVVEQSSEPPVTKPALLNIASITKEQPYKNSLGMKFVPVPGTKALFSIWDTRVQDYEAFVKQTNRPWPKPRFQQTLTHPVVNVSWEDSKAFCAWLTQTERSADHVSDQQEYRLPTDSEWSIAIGQTKYPWGNEWPPPKRAGNYGSSIHVDDYAFTSPVGAFPPNAVGLYDMGGNVWQWCEDWYSKEMNERGVLDKHPDLKDDAGGKNQHVVRGASWFVGDETYMLSATRIGGGAPNYRDSNAGFRCVLGEIVSTKDEKSSAQPLTKVYIKKYNLSALIPINLFSDAQKLSTSDQDSLRSNSWSGQTTLTFSSVRRPLAKVYSEYAAEHSTNAPDRKVDYKVLKTTWFVVSGDLGAVNGIDMGFYIKGVQRGEDVVTMLLEYRDDDFPFSEETFNALSRGFDGN